MMKNKILFLVFSMFAIMSYSQTPQTFEPYKKTDLRLPSVPIIVNDPYFSIWSPYDHLNDGTTRHWSPAKKPITGLLRVDGKTYLFMGTDSDSCQISEAKNCSKIEKAQQVSVHVLATNTYYTFRCGNVYLDLVFTAPMIMKDHDLMSTPINYISYQVRSLDDCPHNIQLLFTFSPLIAVNQSSQPTESSVVTVNGTRYLKTGTIEQPILAKKGDFVCIDWGYLYIPEVNGKICLDNAEHLNQAFINEGTLTQGSTFCRSFNASDMPTLAYLHDFGSTKSASSFAMVGYDEVQDIEYMYKRYKAYWTHDGRITIFDAFDHMRQNYSSIMERCRMEDKTIYDDGFNAGDKKYAEILSGSYRQALAAHKLFQDDKGHLLFFSKENNSGGCVNTVDVTYPSAPLFLIYDPSLLEGMITSIFDYSESQRWTKPFPAHDLGFYPIADGQTYKGDMPVEEAGNMLILAAQICRTKGNTDYVKPYLNLLKVWADYLSENGLDPANQLCTDDFAGHWAHNCNLSIKAIMGIAGYAEIAKMNGDNDSYNKYMSRARDMAKVWEQKALDGDHYRLAFDRQGTWSQKYNMVWDKLWGTHIFSDKVTTTELKYYLKNQNKYGLPLDSRKDYTKNDWIMWTANLAKDKKTFLKFVDPVWNYINETTSRVPISDWYDSKTGSMTSFKARSVVGGFWIRVLNDKIQKK